MQEKSMSCEFVLDMCRRNLALFDKQTTRGFRRNKFRALIAAQRPYKSTRRHFMTNLTRKKHADRVEIRGRRRRLRSSGSEGAQSNQSEWRLREREVDNEGRRREEQEGEE